nr:hypothetical protein [Prolixibacteraceae bacterium]
MEEFLLYLVRVSEGTTAFYLFYLLFFSKLKQFRFNRVYLLSSFLFSPLIPLITITITRQATAWFVLLRAATEAMLPMVEAAKEKISLSLIFLVFYKTGVVLCLG